MGMSHSRGLRSAGLGSRECLGHITISLSSPENVVYRVTAQPRYLAAICVVAAVDRASKVWSHPTCWHRNGSLSDGSAGEEITDVVTMVLHLHVFGFPHSYVPSSEYDSKNGESQSKVKKHDHGDSNDHGEDGAWHRF